MATNDCDETGHGHNLAVCTITQSNDIGTITQDNTASSNSLTISQDGQATNNCDDTTSGDNDATCTIDLHLVVPPIDQDGDDTLNIDQHENLVNSCPGTGTCSISITRTFDPNAPVQFATLAESSSRSGEGQSTAEEQEGGLETQITSSSLQQAEAQQTQQQQQDTETDTTGSTLKVSSDDDSVNNNNNDGNTELY